MSIAVFDERAIIAAAVSFVNADGTAKKTIYTAAGQGARIDDCIVSGNDTVTRHVDITLYDGANDWGVGNCEIPTLAGYTGIPPVLLTATALPTGQSGWLLPAGWSIRASMEVAVTAAKFVHVVVLGGAL